MLAHEQLLPDMIQKGVGQDLLVAGFNAEGITRGGKQPPTIKPVTKPLVQPHVIGKEKIITSKRLLASLVVSEVTP